MRYLAIKRNKSFVGCLGKMKVYIEDPSADEITINQVPCRKLGTLKNGETQTFQIGDEEAKVYVIAGKLSKEICNDYYQIPAGRDNIFLTGKNKYGPLTGNPFRFDNNDSEEVAENRKRSRRVGIIAGAVALKIGATVMSTVLAAGMFFNYSVRLSQEMNPPEAKTFTDSGMSITLTDAFREAEFEGFTEVYESRTVIVFALKERFSSAPEMKYYSLTQYARRVLEVNGRKDTEIKTGDGLTWFEYTSDDTEGEDTYRYFAYVYKAKYAFWLIQFAVNEEKAEELRPQIVSWAKSVAFDN